MDIVIVARDGQARAKACRRVILPRCVIKIHDEIYDHNRLTRAADQLLFEQS
jgi:hypothetical protein